MSLLCAVFSAKIKPKNKTQACHAVVVWHAHNFSGEKDRKCEHHENTHADVTGCDRHSLTHSRTANHFWCLFALWSWIPCTCRRTPADLLLWLVSYINVARLKSFCVCVSLHAGQVSVSPYEYGSFGEFSTRPFGTSCFFFFSCASLRFERSNKLCPLRLSLPADNGSTLSSEAITDSATSTDNNYGYMGTQKNKTNVVKCIVCIYLCLCVCVYIYILYILQ